MRDSAGLWTRCWTASFRCARRVTKPGKTPTDSFAPSRNVHRRPDDPGRLAVLDLPDAELEALAFLAATFAEGALPNAPQVQALLARVRALLPADRRQRLAASPTHPRLTYPAVTTRPAPAVLAKIK